MMNTVKISKIVTLIVRNTHSVKIDFGHNGFKEKGLFMNHLFDLILYVPSTIFQLYRDESI